MGLAGAATAVAGPLLDPFGAVAGAPSKRWPTAALSGAHAARVDATQFLSADKLRSWQEDLDGLRLRATATKQNERYIDVLHDRLDRAGVGQLRTERVAVERWTANGWSVDLVGADGTDERLETVSYIPYSGRTPASGIVGPLAVVQDGSTPPAGSLAGKVAIFELGPQEIANPVFEAIAYKDRVYDPKHALAVDGTYQRWQPGRARLVLDQLKAAGAVAAIGVLNLPPDAAVPGYYPYDGVLRDTPGVYVDRETGARLKAAAANGASAKVALSATVRKTSSRNVLGVIAGASEELLVLNSHTDGPNGIEDNGPNAIVAIAQYLARLPRGSLPRTILVSLTTGHFHGGAGQAGFLSKHRRDLVPKAAAALTLEHLGALQWRTGADSSALTGNHEPALFFAPETSALVDAAYAAAARAGSDPTLVARPITDAPAAPDKKGFPAEGNALWVDGSIPTANFIAGPMYLFNFGRSTMDKFDARLMRAQSIAFTQMLLDIGRVPRKRLRRLDLLSANA
jgi:hypothetical protein